MTLVRRLLSAGLVLLTLASTAGLDADGVFSHEKTLDKMSYSTMIYSASKTQNDFNCKIPSHHHQCHLGHCSFLVMNSSNAVDTSGHSDLNFLVFSERPFGERFFNIFRPPVC